MEVRTTREGARFPKKERVHTTEGGYDFQEEKRAHFSRSYSIKCLLGYLDT
jgi:hypothetical protein